MQYNLNFPVPPNPFERGFMLHSSIQLDKQRQTEDMKVVIMMVLTVAVAASLSPQSTKKMEYSRRNE